MRLETAVTERDKKLLYGAGLVAAVLLYGVFALSPALQAHAAAACERRQAADRRGQMQVAASEAAASAIMPAAEDENFLLFMLYAIKFFISEPCKKNARPVFQVMHQQSVT